MVTLFQAGHAWSDVDHDACALVAQDGRKQAFGVRTREREFVGMADTGRLDLDQDFARLRAFQVDVMDLERLSSGDCDRSTDFHGFNSLFDLSIQAQPRGRPAPAPRLQIQSPVDEG
jgi:hypothetical protein